LLFIIIVSSCEKNVTVNVPRQPPKLVVNGLTLVNNAFRVSVGKSADILETATPATYTVNNPFIVLLQNNVVKDTLVATATPGQYQVKNNTRAIAGNTYQVKVSAAGLEPADASTIAPGLVVLQNISRKQNARQNANGDFQDEIKFSFQDLNNEQNYYLVKLRRPSGLNGSTVQYAGVNCFHSNDRDIDRSAGTDPTDIEQCIDNEFFMADRNFNGQLKTITLYVNHQDMESFLNTNNNRLYKPVIELHNITADHYKYRKSYTAYKDAEDNPFAEPVLVYGNVNKGYGIFSVYNLHRDTIR
jgi:hypothetical protein